jgi:hypothetical protein
VFKHGTVEAHWKCNRNKQAIIILLLPWPESASELYRPSDHRLSTKLVPTFAERVCHVVSVTDPYGRILGFRDRSRYYFLQVTPELSSPRLSSIFKRIRSILWVVVIFSCDMKKCSKLHKWFINFACYSWEMALKVHLDTSFNNELENTTGGNAWEYSAGVTLLSFNQDAEFL